jgi:iron complex outermembrane recepter protein
MVVGDLRTLATTESRRSLPPLSNFDTGLPRWGFSNRRMSRLSKITRCSLTVLLFCGPALAQKPDRGTGAGVDLTTLNIEDLMNVKVTSASKKEQKLSRTAAAIFVISQEDIRRSGATNIPDLLRMVPGMDVGQINGSTWAISSRGFNAQFSNKLLVMIDGRIVYTPYFAGVYWDTLDVPLEDIDRIEVIRGPGGTIWGANAVNGVISIFTKKAGDTHGGMVEAGGGNIDAGFGTAQYGAKAGKATDYRVYTKYSNQNQMLDLNGLDGADGWHMLRGGFRTDSVLSSKDTLTVEGDMYSAREGELGFVLPSITSPSYAPVSEEINLSGGFLQSTWNHSYSDRSDSSLQVSFVPYRRGDPQEPEKKKHSILIFNTISPGAGGRILSGDWDTVTRPTRLLGV